MDDRFRELLKTRDYIIFDGAMGTMLQAAGMKMEIGRASCRERV